jgi:CheY-like chemotaxis protein
MPDGLALRQRIDAGVLVIDDDPGLTQVFMNVLGAHAIPTAAARDEYEAFAQFRWSQPSIILTDITVPERRDTAQAMRQARPGLKIVAMSDARVRRFDFLTLARKFSADAIIYKPFVVPDLIKLLRTFLHRGISESWCH